MKIASGKLRFLKTLVGTEGTTAAQFDHKRSQPRCIMFTVMHLWSARDAITVRAMHLWSARDAIVV